MAQTSTRTARTARSTASVLGSLLLGACSLVGIRNGTPQPPYAVVQTIGAGDTAIEIRRYSSRSAAECTETGTEIDTRSSGFRRLAGFIFGGNDAGRHIAMTAPVVQLPATESTLAADGRWVIRFYLPDGVTPAGAPRPQDGSIRLLTVPAATVAVLRFSGSPDAASVVRHKQQLLDALRGSAWRPAGAVSAEFYDPPWTLPPLRRNEVSVPVEKSPQA
ncbi:heme-binding protein [Acetobacteraceae bacterium KSS8]|uniref:Heme-binding protein n=1 Tax=Endosaccharibacter trunci TaxID=2812733 RepID=A0ABT1W2P6_9PROT|nr:heme-binding protein [Acetobacteraceae bacterium KSS8]